MESVPDPEVTKMKGNNPFHRIRVGDYRIVYEIDEEKSVILVLKIGHRKEVYRHIS
jgi:mRNA interferase RelE/StbE